MAAGGEIPCLRLRRSVRFDPKQIADWLRNKITSSDRLDSTQRSSQRLPV
jgi:hypothetical protein